MKKAFTMIELVVVIVVLGILASIAVSKMVVTRDDAMMVKGKSQVSAIRSAITLQRSVKMMSGSVGGGNPSRLDALPSPAAASSDGDNLFDFDTNTSLKINRLLDYPIRSKNANGSWRKTAIDKYMFKVMNVDVNFTYTKTTGSFDCTHGAVATTVLSEKYCQHLTE